MHRNYADGKRRRRCPLGGGLFLTSQVPCLRESCRQEKLHVQFGRRTEASAPARLLRPDNSTRAALEKPPIGDESVGTGSEWLSTRQSLPTKTTFFAGHSNRTTVLFRPKDTPTTLLRCAASSRSWSPQLPSY